MKRLLYFFFTILIFTPATAQAEIDLPEIMIGQTEITETLNGRTHNGGFIGSQSILNSQPETSLSDDGFLGFNETRLADGCLLDARCFELNRLNTGIDLLTSRTYIYNQAQTETAALYYLPKIVKGDIYSKNSQFNDTKFFGDHLYLGGDPISGSNAKWQLGDYQISDRALVAWDLGNFAKNQEMERNIRQLINQAKTVDSAVVNNNCAAAGAVGCSRFPSPDLIYGDDADYPEGRVYYVDGNLTIDHKPAFIDNFRATIIVNGDLTINNNFGISIPEDSNFGLIVLGNINISGTGNQLLRSAIFTPNKVTLSGSFAFLGALTCGDLDISGITNMRIDYDESLLLTPPPGISYIQSPSAEISF